MVAPYRDDTREKEQITDPSGWRIPDAVPQTKALPDGSRLVRPSLSPGSTRRSFIQGCAAALGGALGIVSTTDPARAAITRRDEGAYEVWTVTGKEVYDLSSGEHLSNVLVDQTTPGATLTIRSRNKTDWIVENIGFRGVGQDGDGSNSYQFQVSTPAGSEGRIENVWASGKARDGVAGSELGGIYVRGAHAGHLTVRHTFIEGFGNNGIYASAVGKDGNNEGSVTIANAYHRDNTASQFRIGSPGSVIRNCVAVVDDPTGSRGTYPSSDSKNARGIWAKHFPGQRIEHSTVYVSPRDINHDGGFEARYIPGRSHGDEAVLEVTNCHINPDAPKVAESTSNARVAFSALTRTPTVHVLGDGGVPLSPAMAARGDRAMPRELPGVAGDSG